MNLACQVEVMISLGCKEKVLTSVFSCFDYFLRDADRTCACIHGYPILVLLVLVCLLKRTQCFKYVVFSHEICYGGGHMEHDNFLEWSNRCAAFMKKMDRHVYTHTQIC